MSKMLGVFLCVLFAIPQSFADNEGAEGVFETQLVLSGGQTAKVHLTAHPTFDRVVLIRFLEGHNQGKVVAFSTPPTLLASELVNGSLPQIQDNTLRSPIVLHARRLKTLPAEAPLPEPVFTATIPLLEMSVSTLGSDSTTPLIELLNEEVFPFPILYRITDTASEILDPTAPAGQSFGEVIKDVTSIPEGVLLNTDRSALTIVSSGPAWQLNIFANRLQAEGSDALRILTLPKNLSTTNQPVPLVDVAHAIFTGQSLIQESIRFPIEISAQIAGTIETSSPFVVNMRMLPERQSLQFFPTDTQGIASPTISVQIPPDFDVSTVFSRIRGLLGDMPKIRFFVSGSALSDNPQVVMRKVSASYVSIALSKDGIRFDKPIPLIEWLRGTSVLKSHEVGFHPLFLQFVSPENHETRFNGTDRRAWVQAFRLRPWSGKKVDVSFYASDVNNGQFLEISKNPEVMARADKKLRPLQASWSFPWFFGRAPYKRSELITFITEARRHFPVHLYVAIDEDSERGVRELQKDPLNPDRLLYIGFGEAPSPGTFEIQPFTDAMRLWNTLGLAYLDGIEHGLRRNANCLAHLR